MELLVEVFDPFLRTSSALIDSPRPLDRRVVVSAALLMTLAIHTALVGSLVIGFGAAMKSDAQPLDSFGVESGQERAGGEQVLEWINLDQSTADEGANAAKPPVISAEKLASIVVVPPTTVAAQIQVPSDSDSPSEDSSTPSEQVGDSQLFGLYVGQINARIERAWLRPRTVVGAPSFACQVRIEQGENGAVEDVALEKCNGTPRWQSSLVQAIKTASPLPAPPDPKVFARTLQLSFRGEPYRQGAQLDLYEPETPEVIASNDRDQTAAALERFSSELRATKDGVVDLRILGHAGPTTPRASPSPALDPAGRAPPNPVTEEPGEPSVPPQQ